MSNPTTIRLYEEDMLFLKKQSEEKKVNKTKLIKELLHDSVKRLKIETTIEEYRKGTKTIRECAELCGTDYREFLNELAERNMIGGNVKLQQIMLKDTEDYLEE